MPLICLSFPKIWRMFLGTICCKFCDSPDQSDVQGRDIHEGCRAYCLQVIRSTPLKPCISCRDAWYLECDTLLGICSALPTVRDVIDLGLTQAVSRGSCETPRASMLEYCALVPKYVGERSSFNCRRSLPELSEARQLGLGHTEKLSCSSCFARTRH